MVMRRQGEVNFLVELNVYIYNSIGTKGKRKEQNGIT